MNSIMSLAAIPTEVCFPPTRFCLLSVDEAGVYRTDDCCLQLHHLIAGYLDTDCDVNHYRLICRSTRNAIDEPKCYFWRDRFLRTFDPEQGKTAKELKTLYQKRRKLLRRGAHFKTGNGKKETAVLRVIRDLINSK